MECRSNKDERCVLENDPINEYIQLMKKADAIVIGSPVYFSQITPETIISPATTNFRLEYY